MTSGGHNAKSFGWAVMYRFGALQFIVRTRKFEWAVSVHRRLRFRRWLHLSFSWQGSKGLYVYMNGRRVARTRRFSRRFIPAGGFKREHPDIFIGNAPSIHASADVSVGKLSFLFATKSEIDAELMNDGKLPKGPVPTCAADAVLHNGACYFVSTEKAMFDDAVSQCAARGGSLLSLMDHSQSEFFKSLLQESFRLTQATNWLLGLKSSNGVFTSWVDGSPLSHTDWAKDEPETHAKERCVTISRKDDFKWVTGLCNFAQPFVCREPASCPNSVGNADPAGNAKKQETEAKTLTVAMGDSLPSDAVVHTIKANILRKSGHVTFQLLRPAGFPSMCSFMVVAEWQTPELTETGWQSFNISENQFVAKAGDYIGWYDEVTGGHGAIGYEDSPSEQACVLNGLAGKIDVGTEIAKVVERGKRTKVMKNRQYSVEICYDLKPGAKEAEDIDFVEPEKAVGEIIKGAISWSNLTGGAVKGTLFSAKVPASAKVVDGITGKALELADSTDAEPEAIEVTAKEDSCLGDIAKCGADGVTYNFRVKLKALVENSVIFSSGGEEESGYGMALFYALGQFQFVVRTRTAVWRCSFSAIRVNRWMQLTLSWQENYGVVVYVNRRSVARSIMSIPRMPPMTGKIPRTNLFIGRASVTKSAFKYTPMVIEGFQFFFDTPQTLVRRGLIQLERRIANVQTRQLSFADLEGSTLTTSSFNATVSGLVHLTHGVVDQAINFTGSGSFATVIPAPDSGLLDLSRVADSGMTVRMRVKFTAFVEDNYYLTTGADQPTGHGIAFFYRFGRMFVIFSTQTQLWSVSLSASEMLSFGSWYKFEFSWSLVSGLELYINDAFVVGSKVGMTRGVTAAQAVEQVFLATRSDTEMTTAVIEVEEFITFTATRTVLVEKGGFKLVNFTWPQVPAEPNYTPPVVATKDITKISIDWTGINNGLLITKYFKLTMVGTVGISPAGASFTAKSQGCTVDPKTPGCFDNMATCASYHGFSYSFTLKFSKYTENMYFLSTGGERKDQCGVAFFYRYGRFRYIVSTSNKVWYASSRAAPLEAITHMVISWHQHTGIRVHMNDKRVARSWHGWPRSGVTCAAKSSIYFGRSSSMTQTQYTGIFIIQTFAFYDVSWEILDGRTDINPVQTTTAAPPAPTEPPVETTSLKPEVMTTAEPNHCQPNPCLNNGVCEKANTTSGFKCACTPDYSGDTCKDRVSCPPPPEPTANVAFTVNTASPDLTFKCEVATYAGDKQAYRVRWFVEKDMTQEMSLGTSKSVELQASNIKLDISLKKMHCCVSTHFTDKCTESYSKEKCSDIFEVSAKVATESLKEGTTGYIELTPAVPPKFLCNSLMSGVVHVEAILKRAPFHDYSCKAQRRAIVQAVFSPVDDTKTACGSKMDNDAWNPGKAYRINVRPKDDRRREYRDYTRTVSLDVVKTIGTDEVCRERLADVKVQFRSDPRMSACKTYSDPHITTFNKVEYNSFGYGEFVLYRHKTLKYAVHAITYKCDGRASCNCGALIKVGNDVIRIDRCPKRRRSRSLPMKVYLYKNGDLTEGTKFETKGSTFIVTLPMGTRISVKKTQRGSVKFVNINIKPSAADVGEVEGMCGEVGVKKSVKQPGPNGREYNVRSRLEVKEFVRAWQVKDTNSLLFGVRESDTTKVDWPVWCECSTQGKATCGEHFDVEYCMPYRRRAKDQTEYLVKQALAPRPKGQRRRRATEGTATNEAFEDLDPDLIDPTAAILAGATWPTKGGITEAQAKAECEKYILQPPFSDACQEKLDTNFTAKIEFCMDDVGLTDAIEIAQNFEDVIKEECIDELSDNEAPSEPGDTKKDPFNDIVTQLCPNDCNGHGVCNEGECQCLTGYSGDDCSISASAVPLVSELTNLGLCDMASTNCELFSVYGEKFVDSVHLQCHYEEAQVNGLPSPTGSVAFSGDADFFADDQVICKLTGHTVAPYRVKVMNKDTYSGDSQLYLPYHSACHTCSINSDVGKCTKVMNKGCFIDKVCYVKGAKNPSDECHVCEPTKNRDKWTQSTEGDCKTSVTAVQTGLIILGCVAGLLVIILACFLCCEQVKRTQRREMMQQRQRQEQELHNVSSIEAGQASTLGGTKAAPGINFDDLFETNTLGTTSAVFVANSGTRSMSNIGRATTTSNNGKTISNFQF